MCAENSRGFLQLVFAGCKLVLLPLFLFPLVLFQTACVSSLSKPIEINPLQGLEREVVLQKIRSRSEEIKRLRAVFKTKLRKGSATQVFLQTVVFDRERQALRLELFASALNQLAFIAKVSEGELEAFDAQAAVLYRGQASAANLARVLHLPLSLDDLLLWFLARVNLPEQEEDISVSATAERSVKLDYSGAGAERIKLALDSRQRLRELEIFASALEPSSGPVFKSTYSYEGDESDIPSLITFHLYGSEELEGELRREKLDLAPQLNPKIFSPSNFQAQRVLDLDQP